MQNSLSPLIYVLAFVAVVLLVQAVTSLLFSSRDQTRRVNRRLTMLESGMKPADVYAALVRATPTDPNTPNAHILRLHRRFWTYCRQAGLSISPARFLANVVGAAAAIWLLTFTLLRSTGGSGLAMNGAVSLVASCTISVVAAWIWVSRRRNARLKALEDQMPLALDVVNRALRAGHPVVSAVQLAANEMGDPIGSEFGLIVDETTYGFEFKDALANFARRTGSPDAHFFAVSVGIQSQTGGNLAEILAGLATVVRGRATLGKRVKALASEGRASALILSLLPVLLVSIMALTQPTFYTSKFSDPIFWPTVGIICVVYLIGRVMINRIINFKY